MTFLYEVRELMEELMSLLKTFYICEEDAILNEWIVQQLCRYRKSLCSTLHGNDHGHSGLPCLLNDFQQMKEILYESLEHFPGRLSNHSWREVQNRGTEKSRTSWPEDHGAKGIMIWPI